MLDGGQQTNFDKMNIYGLSLAIVAQEFRKKTCKEGVGYGTWICNCVRCRQLSKGVYKWTKGMISNQKTQETILPVFYISTEIEQQLFGVWCLAPL